MKMVLFVIIGLLLFFIGRGIGWNEVEGGEGKEKKYKWKKGLKGVLGGFVGLIGGVLFLFGMSMMYKERHGNFKNGNQTKVVSTSLSEEEKELLENYMSCLLPIKERKSLILNYQNCMLEVLEKSNKEIELVQKGQKEKDSEDILIFTNGWTECTKTLFEDYSHLGTGYNNCSPKNQLWIAGIDEYVLKYKECGFNVMKNTIISETNVDVAGFLTGVVACQSDFLEGVEGIGGFGETN